MSGTLEKIVQNSYTAIREGVYDISCGLERSGTDLAAAIRSSPRVPLITEIKFASPSQGPIRAHSSPAAIAREMVRGGALALSVLTQPHLFGGSPEYLIKVRKAVSVPLLMKDIIVDKVQIDAAEKMGADCILLIASVFRGRDDISEYIKYAHQKGISVLLEAHTIREMEAAIDTNADLFGINNRNLDTLQINLGATRDILSSVSTDAIVISESGISTPEHIRYLKESGADAFLVGSSIMKKSNVYGAVRELAKAY